MTTTAIVADPRYLDHRAPCFHPENEGRLEAIHSMLEGPGMSGRFARVEPRRADDADLALNHDPDYIRTVDSTLGHTTHLDGDTYISPDSAEIARLAAGGLLELVDRVNSGEFANGFALVRPPGHHAESNRGMGFCIYNNVAVAARHLVERAGLERVAIVDWDLHHGNGTQHAFYGESRILYCSSHQFPYYPGTGHMSEIGSGDGAGFTVNVPLGIGHGDPEYLAIFRDIFVPVLEEYAPQFLLVSAGFDIYREDPLGGMGVTEEGFVGMAGALRDVAETCCAGKLVFTLEGGYHIEGQASSVRAVLDLLAAEKVPDWRSMAGSAGRDAEQVRAIQSATWSSLSSSPD